MHKAFEKLGRKMSSFTRTIPAYKKEDDLREVFSRENYFIPLAYKPTKAQAGDFIYLIFQGKIVARARISAIEAINSDDESRSEQYPDWANWAVWYSGKWEQPPREIAVQGHQSVRYLESTFVNAS